ncbi:hypothetical protein [Kitasatospora sp. NPDC088346]|uniref:hypothetical protein n=1 Tax=Kitasatospora sp. NPDC088346 TaxID=3364073 RepID=UPI0038224291
MPGRYCPTCGSLRASTACHENLGRTDPAPPADRHRPPPPFTPLTAVTGPSRAPAPAPIPVPRPNPPTSPAPDLGTFTVRPHRGRGSHRRIRHPRLHRARRGALLAGTGLAVLGGGLVFAFTSTPDGQVDRALLAPPVERVDVAPTAGSSPSPAPTRPRTPSGRPSGAAASGSPATGPTGGTTGDPAPAPSLPPTTDPAPTGTDGTTATTGTTSTDRPSPPASPSPPGPTSPAPTNNIAPTVLQPGARGPAVQRMKKLLQRIGCTHVTSGDSFDAATRELIVRYQTTRKVNDGPLGVYGPHTRATLESEGGFACG